MIIVSKGAGILVPFTLLPTFIAGAKLFHNLDATLLLAITFLLNGVIWFVIGYKWNIPIDVKNKSGEMVTIKNRHSLFWIPVEHVGSFLLALGAIALMGYLHA